MNPRTLWGLPAGCLHDFGQRGSVRSLQQIDDLRCFTSFLCRPRLFGGLGRFLGGLGLLGRLGFGGRNVRATCASVGLFRGLSLLSRGGGTGFWGRCHDAFSFRGDYRGEDIDHSDAPELQENCDGKLW